MATVMVLSLAVAFSPLKETDQGGHPWASGQFHNKALLISLSRVEALLDICAWYTWLNCSKGLHRISTGVIASHYLHDQTRSKAYDGFARDSTGFDSTRLSV